VSDLPQLGTFVDREGIERAFRADRRDGRLLFGSYVLDGETVEDACVPVDSFRPDTALAATNPASDES
jgi:hypothetical protein